MLGQGNVTIVEVLRTILEPGGRRLPMGVLEAALAKVFVDVAISTGVDVLSKRATSPLVRGAGRAYKVYALVSSVEGAYSALRISAYSDAAQLIGQEAIIEVSSQQLVNALLRIRNANYEVHREAERYLLTPEFSEGQENAETLFGWLYHNSDYLAQNLNGFGQPLAGQAAICVSRAARARDIAAELSSYPEAWALRRSRYWDRPENWADRLNTNLGQVLWQPVPEIGLGKKVVSNNSTYFGIFRRDEAEGYGCIAWENGTRYYGQIQRGQARGYGALYFRDGRIYFGKVGSWRQQLGALISPNRDWIYYGEHDGTTPDGYGRRVGIANGAESISALWRRGELSLALETMDKLNRQIAARMTHPYVQAVRTDYEQRAADAASSIAVNDDLVLSHIRRYM